MDAAGIGLPAGTDRVVGQGVARLSASIGSRARDRAAVPAAGGDRGRRVHVLRAGGLQHAAGGGRLPSGAAGADAGRDHVRPHLGSRGEPVHAGEPAGGVPTGAACNGAFRFDAGRRPGSSRKRRGQSSWRRREPASSRAGRAAERQRWRRLERSDGGAAGRNPQRDHDPEHAARSSRTRTARSARWSATSGGQGGVEDGHWSVRRQRPGGYQRVGPRADRRADESPSRRIPWRGRRRLRSPKQTPARSCR